MLPEPGEFASANQHRLCTWLPGNTEDAKTENAPTSKQRGRKAGMWRGRRDKRAKYRNGIKIKFIKCHTTLML